MQFTKPIFPCGKLDVFNQSGDVREGVIAQDEGACRKILADERLEMRIELNWGTGEVNGACWSFFH